MPIEQLHKTNNELEQWIDSLGYGKILYSDIVQRLKKVRFLGTMPYIVDMKHCYSRYDHSLQVASIANLIGEKLKLEDRIKRKLVLMGILHDVGHLPFSHASEVFFRETWGKYHTGHGSRLLYHLFKKLDLEGEKKLAHEVEEANKTLHGFLGEEPKILLPIYYEIFHGALSADTLDGITRAAISIGLNIPDISSIINGFEINNNKLCISSGVLNEIHSFLLLKKKVYKDYVYSKKGIAAEAMLTKALELTFSQETDKEDFIKFDDEITMEKIKFNPEANEILNQLQSRNLYFALSEVNNEKYKYIEEVYNRISNKRFNSFEAKKAIEKELIKNMNVKPSEIIFHSTIELNFWKTDIIQSELFSLPITLNNIGTLFNTYKAFGKKIEVLIASNTIGRTDKISLPKNPKFKTINPEQLTKTAIEKHIGAYMTPEPVAIYLTNWAIGKKVNPKILDPSAGEGVFLQTSLSYLLSNQYTKKEISKLLYGIESDLSTWDETNRKFKDLPLSKRNFLNQNFFDFFENINLKEEDKFDVIIGNPPYIKSNRFNQEDREKAIKLTKKYDVNLTNRISSWAPYIVLSVQLLKQDGRFAMVLPTEILTIDYAIPIRSYLLKRFSSITFVIIKKNVFNAQQDVLLLMASNDDLTGIKTIVVDDYLKLKNCTQSENHVIVNKNKWLGNKWTNVLINNQNILSEIDNLLEQKKLKTLGEIADIRIGLVTGANSYFILNKEEAQKYMINQRWLRPVISKANSIPGAKFCKEDYYNLQTSKNKCYLIAIPTTASIQKDEFLIKYLEDGKRKGINQRNKCRNRWPWYSVPMQKEPDAFLTYMSHSQFRILYNEAHVYSTNNIHNIYFSNLSKETMIAFIVSSYSSLCKFSAEMIGRAYGGGVLKLEIGEANKLLLPNLLNSNSLYINQLCSLYEKLDYSLRLNRSDIFEEIDDLVLRCILNIDESLIKTLKFELDYLMKRRILRKHM